MFRCESCTAPLPPKSTICRYCGSRNEVDLKVLHRHTVVKPESDRMCPLCEIPMQTLDLDLDGHFYIEKCARCMSMFFDPNEIETLLEKSVSEVFEVDFRRLTKMTGEHADPETKFRYHKCPVCSKHMNRVNFGARSGVIVDQCKDHGLWLEGAELRRLLEWKKAGGQILDNRRKVEKKEEKEARKKKGQAAMANMRRRIKDAGGNDELFPVGPTGTDIAESVVNMVLKLFR